MSMKTFHNSPENLSLRSQVFLFKTLQQKDGLRGQNGQQVRQAKFAQILS